VIHGDFGVFTIIFLKSKIIKIIGNWAKSPGITWNDARWRCSRTVERWATNAVIAPGFARRATASRVRQPIFFNSLI
jgi:hypothetical protein